MRLKQELARLEQALDGLETALLQLDARHEAELDDAIEKARADARTIAARIDGAILRLESALND